MKQIIKKILILTALVNSIPLRGQNCVQDISTNPSNAKNKQMESIFPGYTNPWKNTFNIGQYSLQTFAPVYLNQNAGWAGISSYLMTNPFDGSNGYEYLSKPGQLPGVKDFHWEDGWELMWLGTGYYPNGEEIQTSNLDRIIPSGFGLAHDQAPYMIYYNRYTGRLRIFSNVFTDLGTFNDIKTIIGYEINSTTKSGIFRLVNGYDQALDRYTKHYQMESFNKNVNNNKLWFSTEFQLAFDPCVCYYPSNIEFRFQGIKTFNLELEARAVTGTIPLKDASGALDYKSFLTTVGTGETGNILFKSLDNLLTKYDNDLENYNTKLKDFNSFENQVKRELIKLAKDGVQGLAPSLIPSEGLTKFLVKNAIDIPGGKLPKDAAQAKGWTEGMQKGLKSMLGKGFDELSYSIYGKEFFKEPQRPSMPSATLSEMKINGTMTGISDVLVNSSYFTPGSYQGSGTLNAHNYPAYNNPIGLFAMLRTPKLLGYKPDQYHFGDKLSVTNSDSVWLNEYNDVTQRFEQIRALKTKGVFQVGLHTSYSFRLDEKLYYRLNHSVDINFNETKVYGLIEVELENGLNLDDLGPIYDPLFPGNTNPIGEAEYLVNGNMEILNAPKKPVGGRKISIVSQWIPMEDIGETLFDFDMFSIVKFNYVDYSMKKNDYGLQPLDFQKQQADFFVPFSIKNATSKREFDEDLNKYVIKRIKLKMMPDIYFHQKASDNNSINTVQVFTYLLYEDNSKHNDVTFVNAGRILNKTVTRLEIKNVVIGPNYPHINQIIGNNLYINGHTIDISGSVSSVNGYNVFIRAKYNINILPNTQIDPSICIEITDRIFNIGKIYETGDEEVERFCIGNDKGYRANSLSKRDPDYPKEKVISNYRVVSYPNPVQNQLFVKVENEKYASYKFFITDLTGKILLKDDKRSSPNPSFEIDLSTLCKGIYFLEVSSEGKKTYKTKFIKM